MASGAAAAATAVHVCFNKSAWFQRYSRVIKLLKSVVHRSGICPDLFGLSTDRIDPRSTSDPLQQCSTHLGQLAAWRQSRVAHCSSFSDERSIWHCSRHRFLPHFSLLLCYLCLCVCMLFVYIVPLWQFLLWGINVIKC